MNELRYIVRHWDGRAVRTFAALRRFRKVRHVALESDRFIVYHALLTPQELDALEAYLAHRIPLRALRATGKA